MSDLTHEDCLEHGFSPCEGEVKFHDRYSTRGLPVELAYKKFPRCDAHYAAYLRDCAAREKASGRRW
jgi:hypothetical protein